MRRRHRFALGSSLVLAVSCAATGNHLSTGSTSAATGGSGGNAGTGTSGLGEGTACNLCVGDTYMPCTNGMPGTPIPCATACAPGLGCVACAPGTPVCMGNEVHACDASGQVGALTSTCAVDQGQVCADGACTSACAIAAGAPSNLGCEFWSVQLDQQDAFNDPVDQPWGVALSNGGQGQANVTVEINTAAQGQPVVTKVVAQVTVAAGGLQSVILPTRTLDCDPKTNDYAAPGTCLSSQAYRITSSAPIVAYQFNTFANSFSNDASLLLPTNALGKLHRIIGWPAGHPIPIGAIVDRSYITVVGTTANTQVTVKPTWRIKGNPPIAATLPGGTIVATIGPFDVLNLETDDGTFQDDPATITDLSGSLVQATEPVAVFSGVESAGAPGNVTVPTGPNWTSSDTCCLDHLEEQIFPMESVGTHYVIARSPVRSTGTWREPDVLRFVGVAEVAHVTTSLPAPFDAFTIQPGEVMTTWTQDNIVVSSDKPVMVGQILVSGEYVDGPTIGDPSLTVFPPVEQYRTDYIIPTPGSWDQSWVVITAVVGGMVTIDGAAPSGCIVEPAGTLGSTTYESRRCPLTVGFHKLDGDQPFGIVAYGYGAAGSYALAGGADVKHVYSPPPIN